MVACTDVTTAPNVPEAIEFARLPYPSIVIGDQLRDSLGVAQPLTAIAFNSKGDTIRDATFTFLSPDTTVTVEENGTVTAKNVAGTARLFASTGGLQSAALSLPIVLAPDSLAFVATDTLEYVRPDPNRTNGSAPLTVKALHRNADNSVSLVPSWLVSFRPYRFHGRTLPVGDTSVAYPVTSNGRRQWVDTTGADGVAGLSLFVKVDSIGSGVDSISVLATVLDRGHPVAGSPVELVLLLTPFTSPARTTR
jgi:hypothetical protein